MLDWTAGPESEQIMDSHLLLNAIDIPKLWDKPKAQCWRNTILMSFICMIRTKVNEDAHYYLQRKSQNLQYQAQ
jgi:hypothetical protein